MAGATTTTWASAFRDYMDGLVSTIDYQGTPMRDLIAPVGPYGGTSYEWNVHYSGNSSTTSYDEGDSASAAGNEQYATASTSYSDAYLRTVYSVTGHALDAIKNGEFDAVRAEGEGAIAAHLHAIEDNIVTYVEAAIDSSGSYGGLTRATYNLASYETAIGTLALSDLQTAWGTIAKDAIGYNMDNFVLASTLDMIEEYTDLVGYIEDAATDGGLPLVYDAAGTSLDLGRLGYEIRYNRRPWLEVKTMTSTTILGFDPRHLRRIVHRPVQVELKKTSKDEVEYHITSCEKVIHRAPRYALKLT